MGSMRNGSGDDWFIHFGPFGAAIKGLAHETPIAGDKVFVSEIQRQVPQAFSSFLAEPAFGMDWASYCSGEGVKTQAGARLYPLVLNFQRLTMALWNTLPC